MIRAFVLFAGVVLAAQPAAAQSVESPQRATASITIERALAVSSVQPMTFNGPTSAALAASATASGDAVIRVTGDPGRIYRVTLPATVRAQPGDLPVETFSIVSDNAGDITRTLTARTDALGVDRLHISGRLRQVSGITLTDVTAAIPVGVDYE